MTRFGFTFGQDHADNPLGVRTDQVVVVRADSEYEARRRFVNAVGNRWSTCYDLDRNELDDDSLRRHFPGGLVEFTSITTKETTA